MFWYCSDPRGDISGTCDMWTSASGCLISEQHIREDFVRQRQEDNSMTAEDLIHLMKVARYTFSPVHLTVMLTFKKGY